MKGYSILPWAPLTGALPSDFFMLYLGYSLRKSYHTEVKQSVYSTASANWAIRWMTLTPLQRYSRFIQQPQLTGPFVEGLLPLCRDTVGLFNSLSWLGHSLKDSYPSAEIQSVYSTVSWLGHSLKDSYPSEIQSVYSTDSADWAIRWRTLTPLQRYSRFIQPLCSLS